MKKDTNPKDAVGTKKVPLRSVRSGRVAGEVSLALHEGALKYGRHNYRDTGVRASVYYDAIGRHLDEYWEGVDIDPASGVHHLAKAIAGLEVWLDAALSGMYEDDRPPKVHPENWVDELNHRAGALVEKYPNPPAAFTEKKRGGL
jgi:hypothetical protein